MHRVADRPEVSAARVFALAMLLVAALLTAAVVTTTLLIAGGAAAGIEAPFLLLCHGIDERSFSLSGRAMTVCSRCFGIYAGIGLAGLLSLAPSSFLDSLRRRVSWPVLLGLTLPLILDGLTQALGFRESNNILRFATGILSAAPLAARAICEVAATRTEVESGSSSDRHSP